MVQPIIGVRLKDKGFVSLLNQKGEYSKSVFIYKKDFTKLEIPVYACKMHSETKIDKVYRIGKISISRFYYDELKENENDTLKDKFIKLVSSLDQKGNLSITVNVGNVLDFNPIKIYETNIYDEIENKEIEDRENALLDYGDFVKPNLSNAFLLAEDDLSNDNTSVLKERIIEVDSKENPSPQEEDDDQYYELANSSQKTKYTIGGKLVFIITFILLISVGFALLLISYYFSKDVLKNAELNNFTTNEQVCDSISKKIDNLISSTLMFYDLYSINSNKQIKDDTVSSFFYRNKNIVSVFMPNGSCIYNNKFIVSNDIDKKEIDSVYYALKKDVENARQGIYSIKNISHLIGDKTSAIFLPVEVINKEENPFECIVIIFSSNVFEESLDNNFIYENFIVEKNGTLISGLDSDKVLNSINITDYKIVKEFVDSSKNNYQIVFEYNNEKYYGAFKRIPFVECGVITIVPTIAVLEPVIITVIRNIYLSLAIISLTIIVIWFFSKTISNPIKALSAAAIKIKNGEYDIKLKPHTQDELGLLTNSFIDMGHGLAERERLKDSFGKFTNTEIAEKAIKGELELGGELKNVTIFFSDIRRFTSLSESLSASEVVEFLNEYMTRMVKCVTATGGFVDKYIGDAIMATWGTPISTGSPREDAINSIRCSLMMRAELIEYNKERVANNKSAIKIGCGINSGVVIAGQIGSSERMEYTCIGDTVNVASRTESLNKPFCTDILITEDTYNLIKDDVIVEKMLPVKVFGKKELMNMYAVINLKDADDIPGGGIFGFKTLDQVREALGFEKPNLDGVDLNEEEKKFRIKK